MLIRSLLIIRLFLPDNWILPVIRRCWDRHWDIEHSKEIVKTGGAAPDIRGSERTFLVEGIASFYPFERILDIGAGYGQVFDSLVDIFPHVSMLGIDVDASRVHEARRLAERRGFDSITFEHRSGTDLSFLEDKSIDVVVTSASLLFFTPAELSQMLRGCARVCRKGFVFIEQHDAQASESYISRENDTRGAYWIHNFERLIHEVLPDAVVDIVPVEKPLWETEQWNKYACRIIVTLCHSKSHD